MGLKGPEAARDFVARRLMARLLGYLRKQPEQNFLKMLRVVQLFAILERHKRHAAGLARIFRENEVLRAYMTRLLREVHPNVQQRLGYNWFINAMVLGIPRQERLSQELGINVPNFLLIDPTSACNLACEGCWAGKYPQRHSLEFTTLDRLCTEAKELGIYWIVFSGGEPLLYRQLFDLMARHNDMAFMAFTNGTLIDERMADRIIEVGNFSPAISLEGFEERTDARRGRGVFAKVSRAMDLLRERGAVFGVSITITRENMEEVTSDAFIDFLIEKGVTYGWLFHYIPIGRNPNPDLMVTVEQRAYLAERIPYIRAHRPIQLADFWNDGELTCGCIAGGRRYLHITAKGDIEPCAFVHFATDNIEGKSLLEILRSPVLAAFKKRQPFDENLLRPCPVIDVPGALREIVAETGARPTHPGAETVLEGPIAEFLDRRSQDWARVSAPIWERRKLRKAVSQ